jgi:pimeloyl-ACP methyl ester carboxylesterase
MRKRPTVLLNDVRGLSQLAGDATVGITDMAEAMHSAVHETIARVPIVGSAPPFKITRGITSLVYRGIRHSARRLAGRTDAVLSGLSAPVADAPSSLQRDALVAALNGVCGDHLAATGNPLAIEMSLRHGGRALDLTPAGLAGAIDQPSGKLLILAHGLCMNDRQWLRNGHDHGAELAGEHGFTPVYLRYNSGLHISTNGRLLAERLEALVAAWPVPVEDLVIIGHSMGGLVARSASQIGSSAGHAWRRHLSKLVFLASPHHGSRLERIGNKIDRAAGINPYSAAIGRLGKLRSAGITDLRYGHLHDEDWEGRDRFEHPSATGRAAPLPDNVECYVVAVSLGRRHGDLRDQLLGDGLVPLSSALGSHTDSDHTLLFAPERQWIGFGMGHLDVLDHPEVYQKLREWLSAEPHSKKDTR